MRWKYWWKTTYVRSHEVRSFLYTENTSHKLLYKPKDWVAAEIKNNIYEIDCSNSKTFDFSESKRSLKRFFKNYDCEKNQIAEHCWEEDRNFSWDQKKVFDRESRLIFGKIKKLFILWRNIITLTKFSTCFLKYGCLV